MKRTQRQDHRLVIDAGASEFPGGKHADRPFLTTNLINTGITRLTGPSASPSRTFSRITAGNGKVAERASPRWLAFSITTQLKVLSPSMPASIATQKSASGSKRRAFATRFRAPARVSSLPKGCSGTPLSTATDAIWQDPSPKIS
ncbi:hypothetical protein SF2457T_5155 [Shigella flexneri 2a str. 2457T]|nr:hypothetical protein SF2457T_5155 [Shigella flexneri 2a str. 2457T]EGJ79582.1 hypothetical protein SFK671_5206 [Shigella flexneri K-671]